MKGFGSIEAVVAAIHEDVRAEIERVDREAAAAIAQLRDEDARTPIVVSDADVHIAAARRQARERLAAEDWRDRSTALEAREAWIARVVIEGNRRLAALDAEARRRDLDRLAPDALARVPGDGSELVVTADGCVAQSADGRVRYDNTYAARAQRLEPVWRAALGELFEQARSRPLPHGAAA